VGDAQRGDDALYYFAANLGRTRKLVVSIAAIQLPDADGPLTPGRYLIHVDDFSPPGKQKIWVRMGKFEKGKTLAVAADVPHFPMSLTGIMGIEVHVRKGDNDRLAAISSEGSAAVYITQVSRGA
jgi:hypothetical protein